VRSRRWVAPSVTGVGTGAGVLLGLLTNVASSLISPVWAQQHAVSVWSGTGVLGVLTVALTVLAARRPEQEAGTAEAVRAIGPAHTEVVAGGSSHDRSVRAGPVAADGVVAVAHDGVSVQVGVEQPGPGPDAGSGQVVVGELPGTPPAFVARTEVEQVEAVFRDGARVAVVCALTGGRGAGKTQVAAAYARARVRAGCPLVAWVSGQDTDRLISGLAEVAAALGVADPDGDSRRSAARLRDALQTRTTAGLLVIDNAEDPAVVREFVPVVGAVQVVVTSTDQAFTGLGAAVPVGVFARAESVAYLRRRTGLPDSLQGAEPGEAAGSPAVGAPTVAGAEDVAAAVGDLPLALAQAAAVITTRGLSYGGYLQLWRAQPVSGVLPADRGDGYPRGAAAAILLSLDAAARSTFTSPGEVDGRGAGRVVDAVLMAVALLAGEGSARALVAQVAAGLLGDPDRPSAAESAGGTAGDDREGGTDIDAAVGQLVSLSLLTWSHGRGSVLMHRLVARTVRDRAESHGDLGRIIATTAAVLASIRSSEFDVWRGRPDGMAVVEHIIHLWSVSIAVHDRHGIRPEDVAAVAPLATWAVRHLTVTADLSRAIAVSVTVLADCERVLGTEHPHTLSSRHDLAYAYESAGDLGRAVPLYEAVLADRERVLGTDHPHTLRSRNDLAYAYQSAGDLGRAIPLYEMALAERERALGADHPHTLILRNNLAYAYQSAQDPARFSTRRAPSVTRS
jgi:tetratricopeptide repeat protein